jgi:hypothetical protein
MQPSLDCDRVKVGVAYHDLSVRPALNLCTLVTSALDTAYERLSKILNACPTG